MNHILKAILFIIHYIFLPDKIFRFYSLSIYITSSDKIKLYIYYLCIQRDPITPPQKFSTPEKTTLSPTHLLKINSTRGKGSEPNDKTSPISTRMITNQPNTASPASTETLFLTKKNCRMAPSYLSFLLRNN